MGLAGSECVTDVVGDSTTEDDDIEEGVGTETVSTVDGDRRSLSSGVETRNDLVVAVLINGEDLTSVTSGDTTH